MWYYYSMRLLFFGKNLGSFFPRKNVKKFKRILQITIGLVLLEAKELTAFRYKSSQNVNQYFYENELKIFHVFENFPLFRY